MSENADSREKRLESLLLRVRTLFRDNPDVRMEATNFSDLIAADLFREIDSELGG